MLKECKDRFFFCNITYLFLNKYLQLKQLSKIKIIFFVTVKYLVEYKSVVLVNL